MEKVKRMKELIDTLNKASDAYYLFDKPIMSDKKYDDLMDELESLETETGVVMANSPLHKVQGKVLSSFSKVIHSKPMLSANKTKDIGEIKKFIGNRNVMTSYKLDGLTLVTRYSDGNLIQAITRGSGTEGEDVTSQAKMIANLPLSIPFKGDLELRGECVISWENFNKINESLKEPYSHPRNLAAGSLRTLDTNITKERMLEYIVFELVSCNVVADNASSIRRTDSLNWLETLGFTTVERSSCSTAKVDEIIEAMIAENSRFPVDGLIFNYEDLIYSASLGSTAHHPLDMIALKWTNETFETELLNIEWNTTRTGRINPTAIFKPVVIEGSSVSRATVHNVSIMEELQLGKGDIITVYKSNQIIPAIDENLTMSGTFAPPDKCPCCSGETEIHNENGSKTLHCVNPDCQAKLVSKLVHAVSKNALNIDGLNEATLEFMVDKGWVKCLHDLYRAPFDKDIYQNWINTPGFGKKSVDKLKEAITKSRNTTLERILYAQGIPLIGRSASKAISKLCKENVDEFCKMISSGSADCLLAMEGFGDTMYCSLMNWCENHWIEFLELLHEFKFKSANETQQNKTNANNKVDLSEKTFVITGALNHFENRDKLKELLESLGAKVSGSVSAKTFALICNENAGSSKSKKAADLGVQVWNENQLMEYIGTNK